jgi:hypothetical protein
MSSLKILSDDSNKIFVKSNKGIKIELKNINQIELIENSNDIDDWTKKKLLEIKNLTFKNNIFDLEQNKIVSSVRIIKTSKLGKKITPLLWEYYRNRGNLDVNMIIKKYSRDNLSINYSTYPLKNN